MDRTGNIPWDEDMPSLVDKRDSSVSLASSTSKQSLLLPQKLLSKNSADSTDESTNPSITADNNTTVQIASSRMNQKPKRKKRRKRKSILSFFGGKKSDDRTHQSQVRVQHPKQVPHTLHLADDKGNVECFVLDANAVRMAEQDKVRLLRPVGLVSDSGGNVECRALDLGVEEMKLQTKFSEEQQQCNAIALLTKEICTQPSFNTAIVDSCFEGNIKCSFYDQMYSQLIGSLPKSECDKPSNLDVEKTFCIAEENLNLPNSKDVVEGITKEVEGGLQLLDDTLDCVVGGFVPMREDATTLQGLAITHSATEFEMQQSETQAEI